MIHKSTFEVRGFFPVFSFLTPPVRFLPSICLRWNINSGGGGTSQAGNKEGENQTNGGGKDLTFHRSSRPEERAGGPEEV